MERKRKLGESDESQQYIMTLLKRLHLERSSELFEKVPKTSELRESVSVEDGPVKALGERESRGGKRWRLFPIMEEGVSSKRRRLDSEMADQMLNNCWISEREGDVMHGSDVIPGSCDGEGSQPLQDTVPTNTDQLPATFQSVDLSVSLQKKHVTLEEGFIQNQIREQALQVMLWTPPLTVETIVQNSLHSSRPEGTFKNEEGESEYMC